MQTPKEKCDENFTNPDDARQEMVYEKCLLAGKGTSPVVVTTTAPPIVVATPEPVAVIETPVPKVPTAKEKCDAQYPNPVGSIQEIGYEKCLIAAAWGATPIPVVIPTTPIAEKTPVPVAVVVSPVPTLKLTFLTVYSSVRTQLHVSLRVK